jgi:hypothetical protein
MDIETILPKIKPRNIKTSDKYSANLYKFLSQKKHNCVVLLHKPSGDLYLTDQWWKDEKVDNWKVVTGAKVWMILCGKKVGPGSDYTAVWGGVFKSDCEDITETFWPDYIRRGRCVFNPTHDGWLRDDDTRFTTFGNSLHCNWCGKWFRRKIKKVVKIERRAVWEEVK